MLRNTFTLISLLSMIVSCQGSKDEKKSSPKAEDFLMAHQGVWDGPLEDREASATDPEMNPRRCMHRRVHISDNSIFVSLVQYDHATCENRASVEMQEYVLYQMTESSAEGLANGFVTFTGEAFCQYLAVCPSPFSIAFKRGDADDQVLAIWTITNEKPLDFATPFTLTKVSR